MKYIVAFLFLSLSLSAYSQTTSTKAKLKSIASPSSATIYRVVEGADTLYYKAILSATNVDDGDNVLVSSGGARFFKLIPSVQSTYANTPLFSVAQLQAIGKQISDSLDKHKLYFGSGFGGAGTEAKPVIIIKQ